MSKIRDKLINFDFSNTADKYKLKENDAIIFSVRGETAIPFIEEDINNSVCSNNLPFAIANTNFGYNKNQFTNFSSQEELFSESLMDLIYEIDDQLLGLTLNQILDKIIELFKKFNYPINRNEVTIAVATSSVFLNNKVKLNVNYDLDSEIRYSVVPYTNEIIEQLNFNNNIIDSEGNVNDGFIPLVPVKTSLINDFDEEEQTVTLETLHEYSGIYKLGLIYYGPVVVNYE